MHGENKAAGIRKKGNRHVDQTLLGVPVSVSAFRSAVLYRPRRLRSLKRFLVQSDYFVGLELS